jgi:hypothetical protein
MSETIVEKVYAVSIINATNQIWNLIIQETNRAKALQVGKDKVLAESNYRITKSKVKQIEFPNLISEKA